MPVASPSGIKSLAITALNNALGIGAPTGEADQQVQTEEQVLEFQTLEKGSDHRVTIFRRRGQKNYSGRYCKLSSASSPACRRVIFSFIGGLMRVCRARLAFQAA
jgi:hypothetical protein